MLAESNTNTSGYVVFVYAAAARQTKADIGFRKSYTFVSYIFAEMVVHLIQSDNP